MKIAIIIAYILIAILAILTIMNWMAIQKLIAPVANSGKRSTDENNNSTTSNADDGSATFGDMITAVKNGVNGAKQVEIKASF